MRGIPLETLKSRLTSTSMRLDTISPVLYTSASMADVQHPRLPLLLLLFLQGHNQIALAALKAA